MDQDLVLYIVRIYFYYVENVFTFNLTKKMKFVFLIISITFYSFLVVSKTLFHCKTKTEILQPVYLSVFRG